MQVPCIFAWRGDASYFGKIVKKPFIGDDLRPVEAEDIVRVNVLLYRSAVIGEILCLLGTFGGNIILTVRMPQNEKMVYMIK